MIEVTIPMIASGLQPSLLGERGAAEGAAGMVVVGDIMTFGVTENLCCCFRCSVWCCIFYVEW